MYEPSWPVTPVMSARLDFCNRPPAISSNTVTSHYVTGEVPRFTTED